MAILVVETGSWTGMGPASLRDRHTAGERPCSQATDPARDHPCAGVGLAREDVLTPDDAAHRLRGGAPEGADVFPAELDGDGVLGDVDSDDLPGVNPDQGDLLPDDHDDAGVAGPPLDRDRLGGGAWRRPGWPGPAQSGLIQVSGMGLVRSN